jgi:signal transduction histidine kinase
MAVPRAAFVALADSATGRLRLETVNDAFVSLTGWGRARAAGAIFPPPHAPTDLADRLAAAVRQGRAGKFELEWPGGADGAMRIELDLMPAGDGAWLGLAEDVTAAAESRRMAQLSEARLDAAIESINEGFALFDAGDRLVRANRKLPEMVRADAGLFAPGAAYADILRAVAARAALHGAPVDIEAFVAERLEAHRHPPSELEHRTADGQWLRITETRTGDGGVAMVYRNVTHLKRVEEALRKAAEEAETANQAKSEFLASMSHELRTPLNAIIGFAEIIGREMLGPIGNARYAGYARDIRTSGAHLLEVINQVLDMSKIEAGRFELNEEELDVAEVLGASARLLENMAAEGGLALSVDVPDPPPELRADRRALRQIALNLLGNAIKFTPRGGRIELGARVEPNGDLAIRVRDTGIGIAAEDIATALAPFGQIDSPMTRGKPGTGLGLPIVKALVELHGGSLSLESEPGKGATVTARFPARRVGGAQAAQANA